MELNNENLKKIEENIKNLFEFEYFKLNIEKDPLKIIIEIKEDDYKRELATDVFYALFKYFLHKDLKLFPNPHIFSMDKPSDIVNIEYIEATK